MKAAIILGIASLVLIAIGVTTIYFNVGAY